MQIHIEHHDLVVDAEMNFVLEGQETVAGLTIPKWQTDAAEITVYRGVSPVQFVVGLGVKEKLDADLMRQVAGKALRMVEKEQLTSVRVHLPGVFSQVQETGAIAEGFMLGTYKFKKYKSKNKESQLQDVYIMAEDACISALKKAEVYAASTNLARDLANEPSNILRPSVLAEFARTHFENTGVSVTVWDEDKLIEEQMMGLIAVGKGSVHKPRFIEMSYQTDESLPLIALVGKGLTFDTGGISLKSGRDISNMRMDMSGAAAVIGALDALVRTGAKCNVVGLIAAAENSPDGASMLPGELIMYRNGMSVQVANTDAEGRLVLADALLRSHELGAKYVIDIATLTGAAASALGTKYAAVFGHDEIVNDLRPLGEHTGDFLWPMPMPSEYKSQLKSNYADIMNIGKGLGGAITAALFLQHFVNEEQVWAHIDMAGPMEAERTEGYHPSGATGFGVRVMAEYVLRKSLTVN